MFKNQTLQTRSVIGAVAAGYHLEILSENYVGRRRWRQQIATEEARSMAVVDTNLYQELDPPRQRTSSQAPGKEYDLSNK